MVEIYLEFRRRDRKKVNGLVGFKLQNQPNSIGTALTGLIPSRNNSESFRISGKQLLSQLPWAPWPSLLQLGALSKTTVPPSLPPKGAPGAAW